MRRRICPSRGSTSSTGSCTDAGRLTESWCREVQGRGIGEDEYIELVTVATIATVIDIFALAIGLPAPDLPPAQDGAPPRRREPTATPGPGWVATIAPENAGPDFADFYGNDSGFYIRRSLTLLPGEARKFWSVMNLLYMQDPRIRELDGLDRSISRAQMEFLASRASMMARLLLLNHQPCGAAQVERHGNTATTTISPPSPKAATARFPTAAN